MGLRCFWKKRYRFRGEADNHRRASRRVSTRHARVRAPHRMNGSIVSLLDAILPANRFYARKAGAEFFTTKQELIDDQAANPPYGTNLTFPLERYTRFCQTSGTSGHPL